MQENQAEPPSSQSQCPLANITLKSLQMQRPFYKATQLHKHNIVFILDKQTTSGQWKSMRRICNKYQSQIYENWKELAQQPHDHSAKHPLYIVREGYEKEVLRELRLNPGLKVIIWSRGGSLVRFLGTKVCFVSQYFEEIQKFLIQNKALLEPLAN